MGADPKRASGAEIDATLDDEPDETFEVSLCSPGESLRNTIVLGGTDITVPLEMDLDGDPFQDDAVCLRSASGLWEHALLSSDEEVTADPDKRHLYYHFHDVPSGVYHVDVQIAGRWTAVLSGIVVSRGEAKWRDEVLSEDAPATGADPGELDTDHDHDGDHDKAHVHEEEDGPCDC